MSVFPSRCFSPCVMGQHGWSWNAEDRHKRCQFEWCQLLVGRRFRFDWMSCQSLPGAAVTWEVVTGQQEGKMAFGFHSLALILPVTINESLGKCRAGGLIWEILLRAS